MRFLAIVGVLLLAAIVLFVVWFGFTILRWGAPEYRWNYKITLSVDTPAGLVSSSSVYSMEALPGGSIKSSDGYGTSVRGEAVSLRLPGATAGKDRWLFVTVDGASKISAAAYAPQLRAMGARAVHLNPSADFDWLPMMEKLKGLPPAVLSSEETPLMVTFDDVTKPESVKRVDPDNLAATFGEDYALKSITLEITDEPVTTGRVEKVLGWILEDQYIKSPTPQPKLRTLSPTDFIDGKTWVHLRKSRSSK